MASSAFGVKVCEGFSDRRLFAYVVAAKETDMPAGQSTRDPAVFAQHRGGQRHVSFEASRPRGRDL